MQKLIFIGGIAFVSFCLLLILLSARELLRQQKINKRAKRKIDKDINEALKETEVIELRGKLKSIIL